jgi:hypothetical protein
MHLLLKRDDFYRIENCWFVQMHHECHSRTNYEIFLIPSLGVFLSVLLSLQCTLWWSFFLLLFLSLSLDIETDITRVTSGSVNYLHGTRSTDHSFEGLACTKLLHFRSAWQFYVQYCTRNRTTNSIQTTDRLWPLAEKLIAASPTPLPPQSYHVARRQRNVG